MNRISVGLFLCLAAACDGGGGNDAGMIDIDSGNDPDSGREEDGGRRDAGMSGDGNDSFASADPIEVNAMDPTMGVIATDGDEDFYMFEGTAGQWVAIVTEANPDDDPALIDTVITLYDSDMNQIAENDDSVPRVNTDSEIITLLPSTGTYYVMVQEFSTWAGDPPESDPTFTYGLSVFVLDDAAMAVNVDTETGDVVANALPLTFATAGTGQFAYILGELDRTADVDVFSFNIPAGENRNFSVNLMPPGTDGYGSTVTPRRMWITDMAGTTIIARIQPSADVTAVEPSLPPGDYNLFVEHAGAALGANDFYVLKAFRTGDNPPETAELTNDLAATPEDLMFMDNPAIGGRSGFILADLGGASPTFDTDHFRTPMAVAGEQLTITCGSLTSGSGVQGLEVTLLQMDGTTEVASDTETATAAPLIQDQALTAGQQYIIRLTKTGQDPEVTGDWVRCGVHIAVPMTP